MTQRIVSVKRKKAIEEWGAIVSERKIMDSINNELRPAIPCTFCGGYYPGDCKENCCLEPDYTCDSCLTQRGIDEANFEHDVNGCYWETIYISDCDTMDQCTYCGAIDG